MCKPDEIIYIHAIPPVNTEEGIFEKSRPPPENAVTSIIGTRSAMGDKRYLNTLPSLVSVELLICQFTPRNYFKIMFSKIRA
jgi:hypothetical protein